MTGAKLLKHLVARTVQVSHVFEVLVGTKEEAMQVPGVKMTQLAGTPGSVRCCSMTSHFEQDLMLLVWEECQ